MLGYIGSTIGLFLVFVMDPPTIPPVYSVAESNLRHAGVYCVCCGPLVSAGIQCSFLGHGRIKGDVNRDRDRC